MAKFIRRKFKRTFKKKRFMRKRTKTARKSGIHYDGMIKVKLQATREFTNSGVTGVSTMNVLWGDHLSAPATNQLTIQDCPEWDRYKELYQQFCVQGVKIAYKPYSFNMGTANIISEELLVGSAVNNDALNTTSMRLAVDFHCQKASRNFNKYVGVQKSRFKNGSTTTGAINSGSGNQRWLQTVAGSPYSVGHTYYEA